MNVKPYWQTKSLDEMTQNEWESLCDGCGKCCQVRLQDDETDEVYLTTLACKLLDTQSCRCRKYDQRTEIVPACLDLRPLNELKLRLLPETCAYKLLANGKTLPSWHPLVSGDPNSVHQAGISVADRLISEENVHPDDLIDFITE